VRNDTRTIIDSRPMSGGSKAETSVMDLPSLMPAGYESVYCLCAMKRVIGVNPQTTSIVVAGAVET